MGRGSNKAVFVRDRTDKEPARPASDDDLSLADISVDEGAGAGDSEPENAGSAVIEMRRGELVDAMETLAEKRGAARGQALNTILKILLGNVMTDALAERIETLGMYLSSVMRKPKGNELVLSAAVATVAFLTLGEDAETLLGDLFPHLEKAALHSTRVRDAVVCIDSMCMGQFVSSTRPEESGRVLNVLEQVIKRRHAADRAASRAERGGAAIIAAAVRGWVLVASSLDRQQLRSIMPPFANSLIPLLAHPDLDLKIEAGQALAFLFEAGSVGRGFIGEEGAVFNIEGLQKDKIVHLLNDLSSEVEKYLARNEQKRQLSSFASIIATVESGERPQHSLTVTRQERCVIRGWAEAARYAAVKRALLGGFKAHAENNDIVRVLLGMEAATERPDFKRLSRMEKRKFYSPNSESAKAWTVSRHKNQFKRAPNFSKDED